MSETIKVYYGTVTGTAEDLANRVAKRLQGLSIPVEVRDLGSISIDQLGDDHTAIVVISTWGEGDPPADAEDICYELYDGKAGDLSALKYSVLALGDSSYDDFCGCGRKVDEALAKSGAQALLTRVDCDVDYEDAFDAWLEQLVEALEASR